VALRRAFRARLHRPSGAIRAAKKGLSGWTIRPHRRLASAQVARVLAVGLILGLTFAFGYLRRIPAPTALAADPAAPAANDPASALFRAADALDARLASNGQGIVFTATQLQLLRPYPNGPILYRQPERDNPTATPVAVDQIILGALSGRGAATGTAFFAEWFDGQGENGTPSFAGTRTFGGLSRDGAIWRRDDRSDADGLGWLATSEMPGFGIDPLSLREFSELLRHLTALQNLGVDADGHHWRGAVDPLWYPGVVSVDGSAFTASPIPVEIWLDTGDRLVGLFAIAQNLNEPVYQLLCVNRIAFDYDTVPAIPDAPGSSSAAP